jgi:hypothetical protein
MKGTAKGKRAAEQDKKGCNCSTQKPSAPWRVSTKTSLYHFFLFCAQRILCSCIPFLYQRVYDIASVDK